MKNRAFTLAEILITLGVIGVVAALTMPTLLTNVQARVRQEQVRTVKYKLTKATDKMNSLGLIGSYGTDTLATERFVEELKKHMTIAKVCDSSNLNECWPSATITVPTSKDGTTSRTNVDTIISGTQLKALAISTKDTKTVGIVTGDGVPMILAYSPACSGFDESKQYTWSVDNGKPVTNATTNCISAIFDINGAKGPNKIGTDVRTLNSMFGSLDLGNGNNFGAADVSICKNMKKKYGFKYCGYFTNDYWVGAIYACDKLGLHLPSLSTLANVANSYYGTTQIGPYTVYLGEHFTLPGGGDCIDYIKTVPEYSSSLYWLAEADTIICASGTSKDANSSFGLSGYYWSNRESGDSTAYNRYFQLNYGTFWRRINGRGSPDFKAICVGD